MSQYALLDLAYDRETYLDFLANRFNFQKLLKPIPIENNEVEHFYQLGTVTTDDDKSLLVFEIDIKPNTQLARNRVQLRDMVAKRIQREDGALAVYVDAENEQWRFSFIAIEYRLDENGVKEDQTASKRFTYLLGEGAQTRTAKARFKEISKQSSLVDLKTAFAVEPLSKEFYNKLYQWYKEAQEQVVFPNDANAQNHIQTSLICLLTRLLFVWFLKEKNLINKDLFDLEQLKTLIDYEKDNSFYKAILQNLFFATLSKEIDKRDFRNKRTFQGKNKHYGDQYHYRYHDLVKDQEKWQQCFSQTPFLNGGLFECLDREATEKDKTIRIEEKMIRMDGFSEHKRNPLKLANLLFFNNDKNKLGLIDLFKQYQFTVEESTPMDIEVALDPELLGKVFENLLASYNPETGGQAQATGSFYTPRPIVEYMVDESLKQYFKQHTDLDESQINDLFIEGENTLNEKQIKTVINAIDQLKILDPAVGSGAYPMGILQRLVFILDKIDPDNAHFKQQQLAKTKQMDEMSKKASIDAIEQVFSQANQHNAYGKKLFLIENCIYGVDIQAIAILIAQLRFFISLTIEQDNNTDAEDNFGIQPLPNLDYHFKVGNSLIGFPINTSTGLPIDYSSNKKLKNLLAEIKPLKHQFFSENDHRKKDKLRKEINSKIKQCYQEMEKGISYSVDFDFKIDFSEIFDNKNNTDGFDIVIGNPPYIRQESIKEFKPQFKKIRYNIFTGTADIYTYFYEKGFNLLSESGHLCYITSNKWMRAKYGEKLRGFFKHQTQLKQIIDFEGETNF